MRPSALVLLVLLAAPAAAQPSPSEGRPQFSRRIPWQAYSGHEQNWTASQRNAGVIFVANTDGILEHDGDTWRLQMLPENVRTLVRAISVTPAGGIYVGGVRDFGVLRSDSAATWAYQSLLDRVPPEHRGFTDVWTSHVTPRGVVFQAFEALFRWDGRRMRVWPSETRFRSAFTVDGEVYVWEDGVGVKRLWAETLALVPGGRGFAERKVDALLPHPRGLLAVVRDEGLVLLRPDGREEPVATDASAFLRTFRPYTAVAVPSRYGRGQVYAIATLGGGIALVGEAGQLIRVYREDVGLSEADLALGLAPDAQGGLWVTLDNGLLRLDLFPRHTWFGEPEGLTGGVSAMETHAGDLFVANNLGLHRLRPGRLGRPGTGGLAYSRFERVPGVPGTDQSWDLLSTRAGLLVATNQGVFSVEGERVRQVLGGEQTYALSGLSGRPDRVFVGMRDGVRILALRGGRWVGAGMVQGISGETHFFQEDGRGALWVSQPGGSVFYIARPQDETVRAVEYGAAQGLSVYAGPLLFTRDRMLMVSRDGIKRIERSGAGLQITTATGFGQMEGIHGLFSVGPDDLWRHRDGRLVSLDRTGADAFQLGGLQARAVHQSGAAVYIGTPDGLMRYDPRISTAGLRFPTVVRRVTDGRTRTLFGGAVSPTAASGFEIVVPWKEVRALRFEFASTFYNDPGTVDFQTRLVGQDPRWRPWGRERIAEYSGLWEGTYTFEVQARDNEGRLAEVGQFRVKITPPWYRTLLAYATYALLIIGSIWALVAWRVRRQRFKTEAERIRNARLQRLGARLRATNEELRAASKLKDDLLANTSHELRTPLTAVLGFSEVLLDEATGEVRELAEGIHRGGQRLLGTVDGLLDMFKLQSGTLDIFPEAVCAATFVRESARAFAPRAAAAGLSLRVLPERLEIPSALDTGAMARVLDPILDNAIKFTPAGGVTVLVDADEAWVRVTVSDTGVGIPAHLTEKVFEPFEQASTGFSRSHEGTGLGLSVAQRVVELLGGSIRLESTEGAGTTVRVEVPRVAGDTGTVRQVAIGVPHTTLAGAHVLVVMADAASVARLREWVEPAGTVVVAETLGRALREARRTGFDAVFVAAGTPAAEHKRVGAIRKLPGYTASAVYRIGGGLEPEELAARGFSDQMPTPLVAAEVVPAIERLLMSVDAIPAGSEG